MNEREIALDTETTGLEPKDGHRIVEIGCVELRNRIPTGATFQAYLNPDRDVPKEAEAVHGISSEFLKDKPRFSAVVGDFLAFIGDARLIIHNADFDVKFLNAELTHARKPEIMKERVFCTLKYARKKFPGAPASLDALCRRFNVDTTARTKHGALMDAEFLAAMYLELMGGSQVALELAGKTVESAQIAAAKREVLPARPHTPSPEEIAAHEVFLKKIKQPLWAE